MLFKFSDIDFFCYLGGEVVTDVCFFNCSQGLEELSLMVGIKVGINSSENKKGFEII